MSNIEPGVMAIIARSSDPENVGVMVRVGEPCAWPGPKGSPRQSGWVLVTSHNDLVEHGFGEVPEFGLWRPDGRIYAHESDLVAMRDFRGEIIRWSSWENLIENDRPRAKVFAFPPRQPAGVPLADPPQ